jgi:hypothetical protein
MARRAEKLASRLVVRATNHGVIGIDARSDHTLMVAEEVIITFMEGVHMPPLKVAILKKNVVKAVGMVFALLTTGGRGIGKNRVGRSPKVTVGLKATFRTPVAECVAKVATHAAHKRVKSRCPHRSLDFLTRRHTERSAAREPRIGHQDRSVVREKTVFGNEGRGIETGS